MGYLIKNWNNIKSSINLSQKVLDRVKPETSLKNRISFAEKKLQLQITRLDETQQKLKQNHDRVFQKIVAAQKQETNHVQKHMHQRCKKLEK